MNNNNLEAMKEDYEEGLKEFEVNKDRVSELNRRNGEICKFLDQKYGYPKGTSRAYFMKKLKEKEDKDITEDVYNLDVALQSVGF